MLAFDVVFPSVEIEVSIGIVEHGVFVEFEPHGVEGLGVVGFAAGEYDLAGIFGVGGCYVDL